MTFLRGSLCLALLTLASPAAAGDYDLEEVARKGQSFEGGSWTLKRVDTPITDGSTLVFIGLRDLYPSQGLFGDWGSGFGYLSSTYGTLEPDPGWLVYPTYLQPAFTLFDGTSHTTTYVDTHDAPDFAWADGSGEPLSRLYAAAVDGDDVLVQGVITYTGHQLHRGYYATDTSGSFLTAVASPEVAIPGSVRHFGWVDYIVGIMVWRGFYEPAADGGTAVFAADDWYGDPGIYAWDFDPGTLRVVAEHGYIAPDSGGYFTYFTRGPSVGGGLIAFDASWGSGTGGVFLDDQGDLTRLIGTGDTIPGEPAPLAYATGASTDGETVVFMGAVSGTDAALWAYAVGSGEYSRVVGLGDALSGSTVKYLYTTRYAVADGNVVFRAYLADGTDAVYRATAEREIEAEVDIKPGSETNPVNPTASGKLPVAVYGSGDLDVSDIDTTSVLLGGASIASKGKGSLMASVEDVDGDGVDDLAFKVEMADLSLVGSRGDVLTLDFYALTDDGLEVLGSDDVTLVQRSP